MPHGPSILSFFWKHARPYKGYYLVMLLISAIASFYPAANGYVLKLFIDTMESAEALRWQHVGRPFALFLGVQVFLDLTWALRKFLSSRSEPYVQSAMFLDAYNYVQHHGYSFFQNHSIGSLGSRIKSLVAGYDDLWTEIRRGLPMLTLKVLVNLTILAHMRYQIALLLVGWSAIYVPIMYRLSRRLMHLSQQERDSLHALMGQVNDRLINIYSLLTFASRNREHTSLRHEVHTDLLPKQLHVYRQNLIILLFGSVLYWIMFAGVLAYIIQLKIQGIITTGTFALIFGLLLNVAEDIWMAGSSLDTFVEVVGDLKSSMSILQTPHDQADPAGAQPLKLRRGGITFQDLHFSYTAQQKVFEGFDLQVAPGEKVGLVGHSGGGKSTLISLLLRYLTPDRGHIYIDGQDIAQVQQDSLRAQITVIPQKVVLFNRTLMENIRYARPEATDAQVIAASRKAQVHEFIEALPDQYHTMAGEQGDKLSGGQRQRIAIARAVLKNTQLLILDEATSAQDSQTEELIQQSLNLLIQEQGKTVLVIAHRLSTLRQMDRIVVVHQGKLLEEGTHQALIARQGGFYHNLWQLQQL